MYFIEKNLTRLRNNQCTFFLNPKELNELKRKLGKENYNIYYPYKDSEKVIVYTDTEPIVMLYEIKSKIELRHQDILGTIFSLNISEELFGDILIINGRYFIYIFPLINSYFVANFLMVKNSKIELEQIDYPPKRTEQHRQGLADYASRAVFNGFCRRAGGAYCDYFVDFLLFCPDFLSRFRRRAQNRITAPTVAD